MHSNAALAIAKLPRSIHIAGTLEAGNELQVAASSGSVESLQLQWLRIRREELDTWLATAPAEDTDSPHCFKLHYNTIPGIHVIAEARTASYRTSIDDHRHYIGVCATVPRRGAARLSMTGLNTAAESLTAFSSVPIRYIDPDRVSGYMSLVPHEHSKYCDRRIRVCTAADRCREGEVIAMRRGGPAGMQAQYRTRWFRSVVNRGGYFIDDGKGGMHDTQANTLLRAAGAVSGVTADPTTSITVGGELYHEVTPRHTSELPPAPPAHAPSMPVSELLIAAPPPAMPPTGWDKYPLFTADIGYKLVARLEPLPGSGAPSLEDCHPAPLGPVEAAPPKAREMWIEGTPQVGEILVGNIYYFGGVQGGSLCWWVKVSSDGDSSNITEPTALPEDCRTNAIEQYLRPPDLTLAHVERGHDPRLLEVTADMEGCHIKFKCTPIRVDGDKGHTETSKPTPAVIAAPPGSTTRRAQLADSAGSAKAASAAAIHRESLASEGKDTAGTSVSAGGSARGLPVGDSTVEHAQAAAAHSEEHDATSTAGDGGAEAGSSSMEDGWVWNYETQEWEWGGSQEEAT